MGVRRRVNLNRYSVRPSRLAKSVRNIFKPLDMFVNDHQMTTGDIISALSPAFKKKTDPFIAKCSEILGVHHSVIDGFDLTPEKLAVCQLEIVLGRYGHLWQYARKYRIKRDDLLMNLAKFTTRVAGDKKFADMVLLLDKNFNT